MSRPYRFQNLEQAFTAGSGSALFRSKTPQAVLFGYLGHCSTIDDWKHIGTDGNTRLEVECTLWEAAPTDPLERALCALLLDAYEPPAQPPLTSREFTDRVLHEPKAPLQLWLLLSAITPGQRLFSTFTEAERSELRDYLFAHQEQLFPQTELMRGKEAFLSSLIPSLSEKFTRWWKQLLKDFMDMIASWMQEEAPDLNLTTVVVGDQIISIRRDSGSLVPADRKPQTKQDDAAAAVSQQLKAAEVSERLTFSLFS